jgi:hypothetical protein
MTALTYTGIATMGAGVVLLLLRLVLRRPADGNDRGAADTPMFKASGPVGLWVIAIGALLLILPATSLVRQSGQDRSLAPSRSAATDDGTTSAQLNACRNLSSALAKESSAAEALNGQV